MIGSRSGSIREVVQHIAHLLHSRDPLPDYHVRCERIEKPLPDSKVSAALWGPLVLASLIGTVLSVALLILSVVKRDGFGLLAILLLSLLSTLIGVGSRWSLRLKKRESKRDVPPDCIVVKYPNGSFRIIICSEEVARELYWHPETCHYRFTERAYRFISLIGTLGLMVGVVCLGNASLPVQVAFGVSYLILNALYWIVAALPPQWHWDLSCYVVKTQPYEGGEENRSFTSALWKAIAITGNVEWVKNGHVAPWSEGWKAWVDKAADVVWQEKARLEKEGEDINGVMDENKQNGGLQTKPLPAWNPETALDECLNPNRADSSV